MRDYEIENLVFNRVARRLREEFSGIYVVGELPQSFAKFPAVSFMQTNKAVYQPSITDDVENAVALTFDARVYSNKVSGKKSEAKEIVAVIDEEMTGMNFVCIMNSPVTNLADAKIYQIIARYTGKVIAIKNGEDTTYMVYAK